MDIILEKKKGIQKKHIPYLIGGMALLAAFAWLIFGNHRSKFNVERSKLIIQNLTKSEFNDYIRVNGQVQPISTIQLSAIEGGMVAEKIVEEGSMLRKGEVIVRLNNSMLSLNILDSEAQLAEKQNFLRNTLVTMEQERLNLRKEKLQLDLDIERKQRKYEQFQKLYNEKLTSREEYLQAKEDYEYAVKNLELVMERQRQDSIFRGIQVEQMEENLVNIRKNLMLVRQLVDNLDVRSPVDGQFGEAEELILK